MKIGLIITLGMVIFFITFVGSLILIQKSCPYIEDVSSCFPYNLPNWAKILPFFLIPICLIVLFYMFYSLGKETNEKVNKDIKDKLEYIRKKDG